MTGRIFEAGHKIAPDHMPEVPKTPLASRGRPHTAVIAQLNPGEAAHRFAVAEGLPDHLVARRLPALENMDQKHDRRGTTRSRARGLVGFVDPSPLRRDSAAVK